MNKEKETALVGSASEALTYLLKYRTQMMACAIICVLIYHISHDCILRKYQEFGCMGVELFFFLSGIGCTLSYAHRGIGQYYFKRVIRILPTFYTWLLIVGLVYDAGRFFTPSSFLIYGADKWFIPMILALYAVLPLYIFICKKVHPAIIFSFITFICVALIYGVVHGQDTPENGYFLRHVGRIPSFFLGCLFVQLPAILKRPRIWVVFMILSTLLVSSLLLIFGKETYTLIKNYGGLIIVKTLFIPGSCFLIAWLCSILEKVHGGTFILKMVAFIGGITLEIFLCERECAHAVTHSLEQAHLSAWWPAMYPLIIAAAFALKQTTEGIISFMTGKSAGKRV